MTLLESVGWELIRKGVAWAWSHSHSPFKVIYQGTKGTPVMDHLLIEGNGRSPEDIVEVTWGSRPVYHVMPTMFGTDLSRLRMRLTATNEKATSCTVRLRDGTELRIRVDGLMS